ncbi:ATP-binding cassette domain-containing protein [Nocardia jiangxiensis]|uniref:ATP-binding cassette domain-containing protein n=1 Tax=Nocardia jiangxiensis TaxID=282685 RepID=A0ABW6RTX7_9NOCA|nr:ABC transporter ATP-binding protein [Nocardia jiangxiensis]
MSPLVEIRGADVVFAGGVRVLRDVSSSFEAGDCVSVLGRNGSGKTTLLRLITGNILPAAGSVRVADFTTERHRRQIAELIGVSMYSERAFYYRLTVDQNLRYFQSLRNRFGANASRERASLIERVGLTAHTRAKFMELSLGQRKRLGLARALIGGPPVVVLDEPFANLDDEGTAVVVDAVEQRRLDGLTTVFTTHEMADVRGVVNKVVTLADGVAEITAPGITDGAERKPVRTVTVVGSRKLHFDPTILSARFATAVDGRKLAIEVPTEMKMSEVVGLVEATGMAVEQVVDTPWLR